MIEIKNRFTGKVIHSGDFNNIKKCVEDAVKLGISLRGANLHEANLCRANLCKANLHEADLYKANLYKANLCKANLYKANLYEANLHRTKGVRLFTAGKYNRLCFTYIYKDIQKYQLGCFNGTLDETCTAIQKKYGKDSSYERIVRAYKEV